MSMVNSLKRKPFGKGTFSKLLVFAMLISIVQPMLIAPTPVSANTEQPVLGVYSFGNGSGYVLGHKENKTVYAPKKIEGMANMKGITAGTNHSFILTEEGNVLSFGYNLYGQLGVPTPGNWYYKEEPTLITGLTQITATAAGDYHSLALSEEGAVYSFGNNDRGQLGLGNMTNTPTPTQIAGLPPIAAISAGQYHSLALSVTGAVYSFGNNDRGQLGLGHTSNTPTPTQIIGLPHDVTVTAISATASHSLILTENGDVYSFGNNNNGQLGLGHKNVILTPTKITGLLPIAAISTGANHSLALTTTGEVYSFGYGEYGQLGHGNTADQMTPTLISGFSNITQIAAGYYHSLILSNAGEVYSFGIGQEGQTGQGEANTSNVLTPKKIDSLSNVESISTANSHNLVIAQIAYEDSAISPSSSTFDLDVIYQDDITVDLTLNGNLLTRIKNGEQILGPSAYKIVGKTEVTLYKAYLATLPEGPSSLQFMFSAGASQTLQINVIKDQEDTSPYGVYSFGEGSGGQLGHGGYSSKLIPLKIKAFANMDIQSIAAGGYHTLILTKAGEVYSFGANWEGQSGQGDSLEALSTPKKIADIPQAIAIAAGGSHSLILTKAGEVYSFGSNRSGELGLENRDDLFKPTLIAGLSDVTAIAAGQTHSLILTKAGEVYSFGYGDSGQLGHDMGQVSFEDDDGKYLTKPTKIAGLSDVTAITAGGYHSLILTKAGEVYSFGSGTNGQLGQGDTANQMTPALIPGLSDVTAIAAGRYHSLILTKAGDVYSFGFGEYGQLGHDMVQVEFEENDYNEKFLLAPTQIEALSDVTAIAAGVSHSLVLTKAGEVYSFGYGEYGQLGQGDTADQMTPALIAGLSEVKAISASYYHSLVLSKPILSPNMKAFFDKKIANQADITVNMELNGNKLTSIMNGAAQLALDIDYSVAGTNIILKKEYLKTLALGTVTLTFTFSAGAAQSIAIIISDSTPSGGGGVIIPTVPNNPVVSTNGKITVPSGSAGEAKLGDEIIVSIPAGAADQELVVTLEKLPNASNPSSQDGVFASPVFDILSNLSGVFKKPITLTLQFDPSKVQNGQTPALFYYDDKSNKWVKIGGEVKGNTIVAEVDRLMKVAVLVVDTESTFADIRGHWAETQIRAAISQGIVSGYPNGTFMPNGKVTRAEFTQMLMNALKRTGEVTEHHFNDNQEIGAWAQASIAQSVAAGIVTGYGDGTFRPNASITRIELAMMVARAAGATATQVTDTGFADDSEIPAWAKSEILFIKKLGILNGRSQNYFAPQATATRAEAITLIMKLIQVK